VSAPRFLAPDLEPSSAEIELSPDESHHLARVLRLRVDDEAIVFDGRGRAVRARILRADHKRAALRILDALPCQPEPRVPIAIVQSVLKGDSMDVVVRDATMAGVARIVPVVSERTQVKAAALERAGAHDRWRRIAIASAKQSGCARLPDIDPPRAFAGWLAEPFDGVRILLVEPDAAAASVGLRAALAAPAPAVACLIGPEGGWSAAECEAATRAGCVPISLGPMTLRADAAGLVAASLVSFVFREG
jgi:16S rRNA (uracil1498-N3)-methyltransferase